MSVKGNILWYADSPFAPSGFGTVSRGIIKNIIDDWRIHCFAINFDSNYERTELFEHPNFTIEPCDYGSDDPFGRENLIQAADSGSFDFDLLFTLQDSFILSSPADILDVGQRIPLATVLSQICDTQDASFVPYFPIDASPRVNWIKPLMEGADHPVTYTNWAREECLKTLRLDDITDYGKEDLDVIYHGTSLDDYYQMDEKPDLKDEYQGKDLVVGYVGRNQRRKMIPDNIIRPFLIFNQKHPNTQLLLKTDPMNPQNGWTIPELLDDWTKRYNVPRQCARLYKRGKHLSVEQMNEFYNKIDVLLLPSSEGWGLPYTEASAAGTPVITADMAALGEIGGKGRSLQIEVPDDPNHRIVLTHDNDVDRPLPCTHDTIDKMEEVMDMDEDEKQEMVSTAQEWIESIQWEDIAEKWNDLFTKTVWKDKGARN